MLSDLRNSLSSLHPLADVADCTHIGVLTNLAAACVQDTRGGLVGGKQLFGMLNELDGQLQLFLGQVEVCRWVVLNVFQLLDLF